MLELAVQHSSVCWALAPSCSLTALKESAPLNLEGFERDWTLCKDYTFGA